MSAFLFSRSQKEAVDELCGGGRTCLSVKVKRSERKKDVISYVASVAVTSLGSVQKISRRV